MPRVLRGKCSCGKCGREFNITENQDHEMSVRHLLIYHLDCPNKPNPLEPPEGYRYSYATRVSKYVVYTKGENS